MKKYEGHSPEFYILLGGLIGSAVKLTRTDQEKKEVGLVVDKLQAQMNEDLYGKEKTTTFEVREIKFKEGPLARLIDGSPKREEEGNGHSRHDETARTG